MQYSVMIRIHPDEFDLNFLMRHVGYVVMAQVLDLGYWWLYVPLYDDFVPNHVKTKWTKKSRHFFTRARAMAISPLVCRILERISSATSTSSLI